ncbi:dihydroneopterin aldolase [Pokkaliibacter plantistimulans]|uniref:7,8-dihydroneopterin aldolase n=2 Tax=Pseudomonadota TaxID=1224 RepID=A0ABX5LTE6_9GAMM|nr:dihydroneopterin aldolase [Pokkaliibacter plantistimulans]PPC74605.1 dihydroneopterin aldolase [Pokkaliibacter plantistimulans]PXF29951.1 dihydroneopterin aldolase [Pokkaliibacter plantistimulans]
MDKVFIRGLAIETLIGVFDWEREIRQRLLLDLDLGTDIRPAASGDDINCTPSYKEVADRLHEFVGGSEFQLVETLAEEVAHLLMREFRLPWIRVRVAKPGAVISAAEVGVEIERGEWR